jgi:hypothetical protein
MLKRSIVMAALIGAVASGCAASNTLSRSVLDDGYTVVRLEARLDDTRKPIDMGFDHPAEIAEADLARILESIRIVQPPGFLSKLILNSRSVPDPAFTPEEAKTFAKPLAAALRTARPDERVVFFLHHQRSAYKGTTSSGIAFVKDRQLNLVLGRYLMGNQPGQPDIAVGGNPFPTTTDQDFFIAPGPFQTLQDGKEAPGGREFVSPKRWLRIDYVSLLNPPAPIPAPALQTEPAPAAPSSTTEEKLKTLKKLHEDGLITDEEYNEKRKEILKSF